MNLVVKRERRDLGNWWLAMGWEMERREGS